ncbi:amidohydrolase [Streptomyces parvulus]|uniref:amidohydrolase n=1 Tax=Streptomyces parvulus TaxID=146923 RepID=UPI001E5DF873|nr:amidohydrolase [Streptomyces parvulus]MCC9157059.1 amidohydrolase [Streptomyces parvulus]MCE7688623.1 amidohydrolase [Streptomyces parvulus]
MPTRSDTADLILTGATVLTMDTDRPQAEAVAVTSGEITALGTAADVGALRGPGTEVIDLAGAAVLPGFVEAHGHPSVMGLAIAPPALDVRPFVARDGAAVLASIRHAVRRAPREPLGAYGVDFLLQRDLPPLTRELLDDLHPGAPLLVLSNSGHAAWANTAALRAAGVDRATPDPPGSWYVRDAAGDPTGEAHESTAVEHLMRAVLSDRLDPGPLREALRWAFDQHARVGITTASDMACAPDLVPVLKDLAGAAEAKLRLRTWMIGTPELASAADASPFTDKPSSAMYATVGAKLWADGTPWQASIATTFPYLDTEAARRTGADPCGGHGSMNYTPEQLAELVAQFTAGRVPVATHVHGDLTCEAVLDAYALAARRNPQRMRALRPRLEHCGAVTREQYLRAAELGATVSLFMDHVRWWGDVLADDLYGPEVAARWMSARTAWDAGHRVSLHNDGVCTPTDPLSGVATAVTRQSTSGRVHGIQQALTVEEALRAVTVNAAWQLHLEDHVGMLRPGMRADFAVLNQDPRAVPPARLREDVRVTATFLSGRRTWAAD